jgi:hypothetical protein
VCGGKQAARVAALLGTATKMMLFIFAKKCRVKAAERIESLEYSANARKLLSTIQFSTKRTVRIKREEKKDADSRKIRKEHS